MSDELPTTGLQGASGIQGSTGLQGSSALKLEHVQGAVQGLHYTRKLGNPVADLPISNRTWTDEHPRVTFTPQYDWQDTYVAAAPSDETPVGAFWGRYTQDGDTYFQGGQLIGSHGGSFTAVDYLVVDGTTGPVRPTGTLLIIEAVCQATVEDGVMLPGCLLTSGAYYASATLPENHTFTVTAPTGSIYREVGRWTETGFLPSRIGQLLAYGSIGNFHITPYL